MLCVFQQPARESTAITKENGTISIIQFEINKNYLFAVLFLSALLTALLINFLIKSQIVAIIPALFLLSIPVGPMRYALFRNRIEITKVGIKFDYGIFPFYARKEIEWRLVQFSEIEEKFIERGFRGVAASQTFYFLWLYYDGKKIKLFTSTNQENCYKVKNAVNSSIPA